jgi:predicted DNA-binding transcriptional regulator AlpA
MQYINRICKNDGTRYHDPGGDPPNDPKRFCPTCGSGAWYPPELQQSEDEHPVGAIEIAELLGVKPQTVHQWHYRGLLPEPRWQVSGKPAWLQSDIFDWADQTGRRWS